MSNTNIEGMTGNGRGRAVCITMDFTGKVGSGKTELLFLEHNYAMIEPIYQSVMLFIESTIYEK
ncbi:MAG: hypothetical protein GX639_02055 [Fibrobacter sp.]|nr:hypothetical protein [Fibrobacter sp.]